MSILDEIFGTAPGAETEMISLFKEDNVYGGIFEKAQLISDIRAMKLKHPAQLQHMKRLFENCMLKRKLTRQPVVTHEDGEAVIWCRFAFGNSTDNLRIANINGMFEFINGYALGNIIVTKSFADLLRTAAGEI
ncbi:hypothetical protein KXQ82_10335 [Mucilaginibacter sp. HMF5004]|uniref:hypothetical protein n=1 Tax=Mucilaginibacter rivuli TaxID=2857527 RepID=UPI001C5F1415|nr:hypothetical protein [Mucilaginibacter rivuli]MBW4890116.1 hypothetical protein [Mucilaginibacter rivuli]